MKKVFITILTICIIGSLVGCQNDTPMETIENEYILINGKTPTEVKEILVDAILNIYMPTSEDDIEKGVYLLSPLATEDEINTLLSEVGTYDTTKKASISNIEILIGTPDNMANHRMKYAITFRITRDNTTQNVLLEMRCNNEGLIESHSLWANNS